MKPKTRAPEWQGIPPRQAHLLTAEQKAIEALRGQSEAQLQWLGAEGSGDVWRLPVLDGLFVAHTTTGEVRREDGQQVRPMWQILALHYLAVRTSPAVEQPSVTFASIPSGKTYASVYESRVNRVLCAGVGRQASTLRAAATALQGREVEGGDLAFEINVFPRLPVRLIWYAGDEELTPSCTILLPANVEAFFCTEDIVVLSESLASRLRGKPF